MHAVSSMDLENILFSEINKTQENKRGFPYKKYLEYTNSSRQKVDCDGSGQEGKLPFLRPRAFVRAYSRCFSCYYDKIST